MGRLMIHGGPVDIRAVGATFDNNVTSSSRRTSTLIHGLNLNEHQYVAILSKNVHASRQSKPVFTVERSGRTLNFDDDDETNAKVSRGVLINFCKLR